MNTVGFPVYLSDSKRMSTTFRRLNNDEYRSREYLTWEKMKILIKAAGERGRHRVRDPALLLLSFRHGLRPGEAATMKWDAVMLERKVIYIKRLKGSQSGNHPMQQDEVDLLGQLKRIYANSFFVFPNERGKSLSVDGIEKIVKRAAEKAGLQIKVHPHMFRHSCGYFLAEQNRSTRDIQSYLGHKQIQNTVRYTAENPRRFEHFDWQWEQPF